MRPCNQLDCLLYGKKRVGYRGDEENIVIAFVGESPEFGEAEMNMAFVGQSGDLFSEYVLKTGLSNYPSILLNAAQCHIVKEEWKTKQVNSILSFCRTHLEEALIAAKPNVIVALGALATQTLIKARTITSIRGTFIWSEEFGAYVIPTYHPTACLRNPSFKKMQESF